MEFRINGTKWTIEEKSQSEIKKIQNEEEQMKKKI